MKCRQLVEYFAAAVIVLPFLLFRGLGRRASQWLVLRHQKRLRKLSIRRHGDGNHKKTQSKRHKLMKCCSCFFPQQVEQNESDSRHTEDLHKNLPEDNSSYIQPFIFHQSQSAVIEDNSNSPDLESHTSPVLSIKSFKSVHFYESADEVLESLCRSRIRTSFCCSPKCIKKRSLPKPLDYQLPSDDITHYSVVLEENSGYKIPIGCPVDHAYQILPNFIDWSMVDDIETNAKRKTKDKFNPFNFHIYNSPFSTLNRLTKPLRKKHKINRKIKVQPLKYTQTIVPRTCCCQESSRCREKRPNFLISVNYVNKSSKRKRKKASAKKTANPAFIRFSPSSRTSCKFYLYERKVKILKNHKRNSELKQPDSANIKSKC